MHAHMPHTREGEKGKFFRNQEVEGVGAGELVISRVLSACCLPFISQSVGTAPNNHT